MILGFEIHSKSFKREFAYERPFHDQLARQMAASWKSGQKARLEDRDQQLAQSMKLVLLNISRSLSCRDDPFRAATLEDEIRGHESVSPILRKRRPDGHPCPSDAMLMLLGFYSN